MSETSEMTLTTTAPAKAPKLLALPATGSGWLAFGLAFGFVVLFSVGTWLSSASMQMALWGNLSTVRKVMDIVTPIALIMAAVGGVLAILGLARKRERSIMVWFAAVAFAGALGVVVMSLL